MTLSTEQAASFIGRTLYSASDGEKIGKIGQVYLDDNTGQPQWVTVATGLFGSNESYVPIASATEWQDGLSVPFSKTTVKDAPNVAVDQHISEQEEAELYRYYDIDYTAGNAAVDTSYERQTDVASSDVADTARDDAMTRSEEHLRAGTERVEAGRARLRKYVVTENETITVPVTKERVVLETEPITDANRAESYDGPEITEREHEVILHEERPVVTTEAVAVERVHLGTRTETTQETVSGEVRKERIELDADDEVRADSVDRS